MLRRYILMTAVFLSFSQSIAQEGRIKINANKRILLEYDSKSWNKNPNAVETGALILRDGITKKLARIELFESDMDSTIFRGQYLLTWGEDEIVPEVYLAPAGTDKTAEQLVKIEANIQSGTLLRKPFFARSNNKSFQTLTVFDNKEQALKAYELYIKLNANKNAVNTENLETQASLQKQVEITNQANNVSERAKSRVSLEEEESRKRQEAQALQDKMNAQEREAKEKEARALAKRGLELYNNQKYPESERNFAKATELDPANTSFYYQYAVTLFKNDKNNKSIALFNITKGKDVNEVEKKYYLGLNYMKLQDFDKADENFSSVKESKDKSLGPASAFYLGIVRYQSEKYEDSKKEFEYVLDNSSDAGMDKQAEAYIEQIANIMAFKKEEEKRFILSLNLGLMYDSNILSVQNSVAGTGSPTDLAGYRWSYGGSLEYRPIYEYTRELSVIASVSDMYSTDNKFAAKKTFQDTDPQILGISVPYKIKGTAFSKAYQGSYTPGYESILMNSDGVGAREAIVNSLYLKTDHTFVMNDSLYSTYQAEIRSDKSLLATTGDDDQSATKLTLGTLQTMFQDSKKTRALIGDLSLSQNNAIGKNAKFFRYDLGLAYMTPWNWGTVVTGKLAYYDANYKDHSTGRQDKNTTVILGLSKPLTEKLSSSLTGIYTTNQSTLSSSDYRKYMIMTNLSWSTSL